MFRFSRPKLGMCLTYVSTFPTKIGYFSTVLDLCFDFPDQNWAYFDSARPIFRLSRPKLGMCLTYDSTFLTEIGHVFDLCFDFPDHNWACFDCARLMFRLSKPKLGMFRLCSTYVLTFPIKIGHVSIVLDLCFDFPDRNWACA